MPDSKSIKDLEALIGITPCISACSHPCSPWLWSECAIWNQWPILSEQCSLDLFHVVFGLSGENGNKARDDLHQQRQPSLGWWECPGCRLLENSVSACYFSFNLQKRWKFARSLTHVETSRHESGRSARCSYWDWSPAHVCTRTALWSQLFLQGHHFRRGCIAIVEFIALSLFLTSMCSSKIHSLHLAEQSTRELPTHSQEGDTFEESASGFDTLLTRVRLFFSSLLFSLIPPQLLTPGANKGAQEEGSHEDPFHDQPVCIRECNHFPPISQSYFS